MAEEETETTVNEVEGGFVQQSLHRNNKQIRSDRAEDLLDELQTGSRRKCEDLLKALNKLKRQRRNMYDFSPTNAQSLVLAAEVDGEDQADKDLKLSVDIRDAQIKYDLQVQRYKELYGKDFTSE